MSKMKNVVLVLKSVIDVPSIILNCETDSICDLKFFTLFISKIIYGLFEFMVTVYFNIRVRFYNSWM